MKKILLLMMAGILAPAVTAARDVYGTWSGLLDLNGGKSLRIVLHFQPDSVTMDSPDQKAYGIKGEINHLASDSVNVGVARLLMNFSGRLRGDSIAGTFRQGALRIPLTLVPGEIKYNRPQTPQPPFPYAEEAVRIEAPGAVLSGTLTLPENASEDTPVVVLVSGSGLQNRDEEIFEHRPFAVIADYLARRGIASLRYDDRGFGQSKGEYAEATTVDFASDARAVAEYLRRSRRFGKIGMVGHSEGGLIGYMLGAEPGLLDFVVSIAGPSVAGARINAYQNKVALIAQGVDEPAAEAFSQALLKAILHRLENPPLTSVPDDVLRDFYPQYADSPESGKMAAIIKATLTMEKLNPWMEYFLRYDPAGDMRRVAVPTFIIYGKKDCQVPPSLCVAAVRENAPAARMQVYEGLNHLMQHAVSGTVDEYKDIEETISPEVLSDIAGFILGIE